LPVPGQEFGDAPRRVVGNAGEHVGEIVLRIETVERRSAALGSTATGTGHVQHDDQRLYGLFGRV
jgi:hypothetical protein